MFRAERASRADGAGAAHSDVLPGGAGAPAPRGARPPPPPRRQVPYRHQQPGQASFLTV